MGRGTDRKSGEFFGNGFNISDESEGLLKERLWKRSECGGGRQGQGNGCLARRG